MRNTALKFIFRIRIIIVFILIVTIFSIMSPYFLKLINIKTILMAVSILGMVSVGQTLCLITGNFDLSVGQNVALCAILATILSSVGVPFLLIMPIIFILGLSIGFINAVLITKAKINAFIVTLGMMTILQGIVYVITGGEYISTLAKDFSILGSEPRPIYYLFIIYIVAHMYLKYTSGGKYIYAIGSNSESVKLAGISVDFQVFKVYLISGFLCAFSGMTLASRLGAASTGIGLDYPLQAVAASVIGGVALTGGRGKILMTLIGALIIGCINNGLILIGVPSSYKYLVTGLVLIAAVLSDSLTEKVETI